MKLRARDKSGKYDFHNMKLICTCGHPLSVHSGINDTHKRMCLNEDKNISGATGTHCNCKNFCKK